MQVSERCWESLVEHLTIRALTVAVAHRRCIRTTLLLGCWRRGETFSYFEELAWRLVTGRGVACSLP